MFATNVPKGPQAPHAFKTTPATPDTADYNHVWAYAAFDHLATRPAAWAGFEPAVSLGLPTNGVYESLGGVILFMFGLLYVVMVPVDRLERPSRARYRP